MAWFKTKKIKANNINGFQTQVCDMLYGPKAPQLIRQAVHEFTLTPTYNVHRNT